ncbi:MAG: chitobiase/beta-hexosaminidase C-terminal domain-containing protein, partial [Ruminiclostridium sp.]|nr:chitobiase/beta-hexosaminidase C-terminal domain-containing protein [Ruminiclostridium sp.]
MNVLLKKAAAILTAGIMTAAGISAESFAESGKLSVSYNDLSLEAAVAKPTYTVKGSLGVRKIRLSCATPGATIYYTADGSTPTSKSKVYREGSFLKTTKDCVIRAVAIKGGVSSAVMKKTIKIKTMYGDVTGDGNINQNDYSRFRNYLNGNTTFICKDNADCNGSGGLSSKDLTVLEQYLNDRITSLPADPVTSVKRPGAVISKVVGGKSVTLNCSTSGADIYYTTNGAIPETSGIRYNAPFVLTENAVVKAVAVKSGDVSALREFDVSVPKTSAVTSDKSTSTTYDAGLQVKLSTSTPGASIFYTIDGSDPITSRTTEAYSSSKPISITKTTTIKAYARTKGYADSSVSTYTYNIKDGFTISGT